MSDKIARIGIERDNDMMYYIKNGDVWATPRKQKGQPKGKAQKIAATGLEMDYLDADGDVARKERALGGAKRKAKAPKAAKLSKAAASPPARKAHETVWSGKGKKSEAQLDAEIAECLAQAKKKGGNGNSGNGTNKPANKKRR